MQFTEIEIGSSVPITRSASSLSFSDNTINEVPSNNIIKTPASTKTKQPRLPRKEKKETIIRTKKLRGEEHVNHVGNFVEAKVIGPDCKCKRLKCFKTVSRENREEIFKKFYQMKSKDLQDSYLAALMNVQDVKQRRPRIKSTTSRITSNPTDSSASDSNADEGDIESPNKSAAKSASIYYTVRCRNAKGLFTEVSVCRAAFESIHGITPARIRRIYHSLIHTGHNPTDTRGRYANRPGALPTELKALIKLHIFSFAPPHKREQQLVNKASKSCSRICLPETLTIRKMYKMFLNAYQICISYRDYWNIFTNDFNFKFNLKAKKAIT